MAGEYLTEDGADPDWPQPGDSLTRIVDPRGGHPAYRNACVNLCSVDPWNTYIAGYGDAAEALIQHTLGAGRDQDTLIYPILFLCHHHAELALKKAIDLARTLYDSDVPDRGKHDLLTLWQDLGECMRSRGPMSAAEQQEWRAVGRCLRQLNALGAEGEAFRYPAGKSGQVHTLRNPLRSKGEPISLVDLHELGRLMRRIRSFLGALVDMLTAELQARGEMEHDAAGNWY